MKVTVLDMDQIVVSLLSGVVGALLATFIQSHLHRKYDRLQQKRDVLRRFVGNRHLLTRKPVNSNVEPFIALNEIFVVFADCPSVISALRKFHEELGQSNREIDNILTLVKTMATASDVQVVHLNDDFIARPFAPGQ